MDHRVTSKESEKKGTNLYPAKKKQRNMKVTIIPILIGALGTVTKWLLQGLEDVEIMGRVKTI